MLNEELAPILTQQGCIQYRAEHVDEAQRLFEEALKLEYAVPCDCIRPLRLKA